jgi:hypothetical protein
MVKIHVTDDSVVVYTTKSFIKYLCFTKIVS